MIAILPLTGHHDRKAFDCGNNELNHWLANVAQQHRAKGVSSTYVAVESDASTAVLGFYAVSIAELRGDEMPSAWTNKLPHKVPVFRLGRLAIAKQHQGTGLGAKLLANAISRARRLSSEVGGIGILVDAKPDAVGFYEQYGFEHLADHPLKLFLRI
jgi:GNAT superfamily N-acetyltransferase